VKERDSAADASSAWSLGLALGIALVLVGLMDLALLFYPPHWASLDWEFGTIGATIEGLPLLTMGLGLVAMSSAADGRTGWMRLVSIVLILLALFVIALLVIFALDIPVALRAVQPAGREVLKKSIIKTGGMGAVYVMVYAVLGVKTWRRIRISK